jgi:flagellar assembly factor FliW
MVVESTRFGRLDVTADAVIDFPNGLIGLGGRRYVLLARGEESPFVWLHSLDDPALALPLTNPWRFFASYEVELAGADARRIGAGADGEAGSVADETSVYVTVRAADAIEDFTANLRAPILMVGDTGHQVVNQADFAPVRAPLFEGMSTGPGALAVA